MFYSREEELRLIDPVSYCSGLAEVWQNFYRTRKDEMFDNRHPDQKLRFALCRLGSLITNVKVKSDPDDYEFDYAYMSETIDEVVLMLKETSSDYLKLVKKL